MKNVCIDNIWNFATFNLYNVPQKIIYLQSYSTDFRNLFLRSKLLRVAIWVERLRCAGILLLQWQGENLSYRQHLKFSHFQTVHCDSKNPISPKVVNRFSKSLPQLEDVEGQHKGEEIHARRYFTFAMGRWELCASKHLKFCNFQPLHCASKKSYISKGIPLIFEIISAARRCWGWAFVWKVPCAQVFYFGDGTVKTLRIDNIWYFATFSPLHCAWKNPISPKVFNRFSKSFPLLEEFEGGHLGGKFQARRYFTFAMASWKLCTCTIFEISHFQSVHCHSKYPISPKVFHRFSKSLPELEDVEAGHLGGKIQARSYFTFAMARWNRCVSTTFEILPLSTCTLCLQKSCFSKGIQPIFEILASARRC